MPNFNKLLSLATAFEKKAQESQVTMVPGYRPQVPNTDQPAIVPNENLEELRRNKIQLFPKRDPKMVNALKALFRDSTVFYNGIMQGTSDKSLKNTAINIAKLVRALVNKTTGGSLTTAQAIELKKNIDWQVSYAENVLKKIEQENPYDERLQALPYLLKIKESSLGYQPVGTAPVPNLNREQQVAEKQEQILREPQPKTSVLT